MRVRGLRGSHCVGMSCYPTVRVADMCVILQAHKSGLPWGKGSYRQKAAVSVRHCFVAGQRQQCRRWVAIPDAVIETAPGCLHKIPTRLSPNINIR